MHFTPTYSSWLNQVERLFAEVTRELLQRSDHRSVQALEKDLRNWVKAWNEGPQPCVWTKTAEEILSSIARYLQRINDAGHETDTLGFYPLFQIRCGPRARKSPGTRPGPRCSATGSSHGRAGPGSPYCSTRRWRANSLSTTPAATEALRDSTQPVMGTDMMTSQFSRTSREMPLPSEPTTMTTGSVPPR